MRITRELLRRSACEVAPDLLGAVLRSDLAGGRVAIRLTEVEAYGGPGEDPASHAYRGRTARNEPMFGPPGRAYVYFVYGMHWCLNVVTGDPDEVGAVLLRAGEVVQGHALARARRTAARDDRDLARGPARLAVALGVDRAAAGLDLLDARSPLVLRPGHPVTSTVESGPRVGIRVATGTPWRFLLSGDPTVSGTRRPGPANRVRPGSRGAGG
jgi:DNA-3-methyladenine glycosylase